MRFTESPIGFDINWSDGAAIVSNIAHDSVLWKAGIRSGYSLIDAQGQPLTKEAWMSILLSGHACELFFTGTEVINHFFNLS